jgi:ureidoglycolate hydrolase
MSQTKPQVTIPISKLTDDAFAPYGKVIWDKTSEDRQRAQEEWTTRARTLFGAQDLDIRPFALAGKPLVFEKIEVHHKSYQLTIVFGAPWVVALFKDDMDARDQIDAVRTVAFEVPPRVGLVINAGVWHGGLGSESDSDALVFFLPGTTQHASSVRELAQSVKLLAR